MKTCIILALCVCLSVSVTACMQHGDLKEPSNSDGVFESEPQSETTAPQQQETEQSSGTEMPTDNQTVTEPPEGTTQVSFSAPIADEMGIVLDDTIDFSLYLPGDWTVTDLEISEDGRKVAEALPSRIIYNKIEPFEDTDFAYAEAITVRDITAGLYLGKCYHMQTEVMEGGLRFYQNDIIYCLNIGDKMILIVFYPSYGIGIGTQNEQFSSYLNTIQLSEENNR